MIPNAQAASVARTVINALLDSGARRAVKYLSPTETVVVARPIYRHKSGKRRGLIIKGRESRTTLVLTFGRPNAEAFDFIQRAKKAGEPFPVQKVQLRFPVERVRAPKRRALKG